MDSIGEYLCCIFCFPCYTKRRRTYARLTNFSPYGMIDDRSPIVRNSPVQRKDYTPYFEVLDNKIGNIEEKLTTEDNLEELVVKIQSRISNVVNFESLMNEIVEFSKQENSLWRKSFFGKKGIKKEEDEEKISRVIVRLNILINRLEEMKTNLELAINIEEFLSKRNMKKMMDDIRNQLKILEKKRQELNIHAKKRGDKEDCIVCMSNKKTEVCLPCKHFCLCGECMEQIVRSSQKCPICRQVIDDVMSGIYSM